jgi:hypothetical protein
MNQKDFLLKQATQKLSKAVEGAEQFPLSILAAKSKQIAEANPLDHTSVGMYQFLSKKASQQLYIRRNEFKSAYNTFFTKNNKFAAAFEKELGEIETLKPTFAKRATEFKSEDSVADPFLTEAFSRIVEKRTGDKFSQVMGKQAATNCSLEINRIGVRAKFVEAVAGQENLIICRAAFETPRGTSSFLIPIEVNQGRALLPSIFLSAGGFFDLNEKNFHFALNKFAGEDLQYNAEEVLKIVSSTIAKTASVDNFNEVEKIVLKAKLASAKPAEDQNAIFAQNKIEPVKSVIAAPKLPPSGEIFSNKLTSPLGAAEFLFGKNSVEKGRNSIINRLDAFGYTGYQIKVANANETSTIFDVALSNKTFKVPVKMNKMYSIVPEILISEGSILPFSKEGIDEVSGIDIQTKASFSPGYELSSEELIEIVRTASIEKNKEKVEDALNILLAKDMSAFRSATQIWMDSLSGKLAPKTSGCRKKIKVANHSSPICGCLNQPLDKVYQDEFGDCRPLWTKKSAAAQTFMSSHNKIYYE